MKKNKTTKMLIMLVSIAAIIGVNLFFKPFLDDDKLDGVANQNTYQGEDWVLDNLKGEKIRLSNYQGQPVLLVFWATWCPYCKKLLPGIAELNDKYKNKGLKIIAVNIREDWKPAVYWRNHGYTFESVLEGDSVAMIYGVRGTPGIVFIEPSGKVLGTHSFSDPHHPLLEQFAAHYTSSN